MRALSEVAMSIWEKSGVAMTYILYIHLNHAMIKEVLS